MPSLSLTELEDLRDTAGSYLHFLLGGRDSRRRGFLHMRNVIPILVPPDVPTVRDALDSLTQAGVGGWTSAVAFLRLPELQDAVEGRVDHIDLYFYTDARAQGRRSMHRRALIQAEQHYFPDEEFGAFTRLELNVGQAAPELRPVVYSVPLDGVDRAFLAWWRDPDSPDRRELWQEYVHFDRIRKAQHHDRIQRSLAAWRRRARAAGTIRRALVDWAVRPGGAVARMAKRRFEEMAPAVCQ